MRCDQERGLGTFRNADHAEVSHRKSAGQPVKCVTEVLQWDFDEMVGQVLAVIVAKGQDIVALRGGQGAIAGSIPPFEPVNVITTGRLP
jgi:hypothetical protein